MYEVDNSNLPPPHLLEALRFWGGPSADRVIKQFPDGRALLQYADGHIVRRLPDGRMISPLFHIGPGGEVLSRSTPSGCGDALDTAWNKLEAAAKRRR